MEHVSFKTVCFVLIVKLAITAFVLADDVSHGTTGTASKPGSLGRDQYQGFGFFNSANRTDSLGEKGVDDSPDSIAAVDPSVSPVTSTTNNPTTVKKTGKKGKKNNNKVDLVIDAPVVESGENVTDGVFLDPEDNTLNIAIGGANISIDLSDKDAVQVVNTTVKPLNGEEIPNTIRGQIPVFLKLAKDSSRRDFLDIETNNNIQKCYYIQALMNWANVQNPEIKAAFYSYIDSLKLEKEQLKAQQDAKVQLLSTAAQEAHKKIQEIMDDDQISKKQESQRITEYFDGLPASVQSELNTLTA